MLEYFYIINICLKENSFYKKNQQITTKNRNSIIINIYIYYSCGSFVD